MKSLLRKGFIATSLMFAISGSALIANIKPAKANFCNPTIVSQSYSLVYRRGAIWRTCKGYALIFQNDGNLVIYNPSRKPIWATGTEKTGANRFAVQSDGNVVLYVDSTPLWATNTSGKPGSRLVMQDDGNLVVYLPTNQPIFDTGTWGGQVRTFSASYQWWERSTSSSTVTSRAIGGGFDGSGNSSGQLYVNPQAMYWNRSQRWNLRDMGGGQFMLLNEANGKPLDGGGANGSLPYLHPQVMTTNPYQRWRLQPSNGGYMLINVATGRALDSGGANRTVYMHPTPISGNSYHIWDLSKPPKPSAQGDISLPFSRGQTWYVCQGYNGSVSHRGYPALDLTVGSTDFGNNNSCWAHDGNVSRSARQDVLAPATGTISWVTKDLVCLSIDHNRSLLIGHIDHQLSRGQSVSKDSILGKLSVAVSINGGFSHIHLEARRSSNCAVGTAVPFTSQNGFQLEGVGDLPNGNGETHWKRALTRP